jgi:hypothetical protein
MKRKSLAQITYEKCGGVELHGPWDRALFVVKDAWEMSTKMSIRQAFIRLKWDGPCKKIAMDLLFPKEKR